MSNNIKKSVKLFNNRQFLMIISLLAAVLFWFIVVMYVSPDYRHNVSGIKVNINESSGPLASIGLHAVDTSSSSVSIEVSGPRYLIGRLAADDFTVTPDVSEVSKSGEYRLNLSASLKIADGRIRISKISPSYITGNFDTLLSKTLPVEIKLKDEKVAKGYLMQTALASPTQVTITGPTTELSKVSTAAANVNVDSVAINTQTIKSIVELYDKDGNKLPIGHMKLSSPSVTITVPILKTKDVPLKVSFTNIPNGFNQSNIVCNISPSSLNVAGDTTKISTLDEIDLGEIDFSKLNINSTLTMDVPDLDGLMNVSNISNARITVELKNTASKILSTKNFTVINNTSGYKVVCKTKQLDGIMLFGPAKDISSVNNVVAVIDMSKAQGTGQYEVTVDFEVVGKTGYWVCGEHKVVIDVS